LQFDFAQWRRVQTAAILFSPSLAGCAAKNAGSAEIAITWIGLFFIRETEV
jgi:hypothetical protein